MTEAVAQGGLLFGTDARALARMIDVTLGGSFLEWTLRREGDAATRMREDFDATLWPYLVEAAAIRYLLEPSRKMAVTVGLVWYRYGDSNPGPVAENHVS